MGSKSFTKSNILQIRGAASAEYSSDLKSDSQTILPGVKLGQSANLMYGFKFGWDFKTKGSSPFYAPKTNPLPESNAEITPSASAIWSLPSISIYSTANSLLDAIFPYTVKALNGDSGKFSVGSGALMTMDLDRDAVLSDLAKYLDIDLTKGDSYMLVEINRKDGEASSNYVAGSGGSADQHLTKKALTQIEDLLGVEKQTTAGLDAKSAQAFIDNFEQIGTHYVSQVSGGDRIFQVFAYQKDAFSKLKLAFDRSANGNKYVKGVEAISFQYYTSPVSTNTGVKLGYVSQRGKINIVSNDAVFTKSLSSGSWKDAQKAKGNSIFTAFDQNNKIDLDDFKSIVPVSIELSPIGDLIPVNKSAQGRQHWNDVFKGVMLQKYSEAVSVTFASQNSYDWKSLLPNSGAWLSTIATPTVNVYDAHLALDKIELTNREAVKSFSSWSVVLESTQTSVSLPGDNVALYSYLIDTSGMVNAPVIQLSSKAAFNSIKMACGKMDGALSITYEGGQELKTVLQGVELVSQTATAGPKRSSVKVSGDLFGALPNQVLDFQTPNINFSIVTCQTLLYARGATAKNSEDLARDCLTWLTEIIPSTDSITPALAAIGLRASYLAHVAKNLDEVGTEVPYLTYSSYENYIGAMTTAARSLNNTIYQYQNKIDIQKNAELTAKTAAEINANVKISGNILKEYIDAVAVNQGDIADNYQNIINTKERELKQALTKIDALVKGVNDQKQAVTDAKIDFEFAMRDYETSQIIKAVISISMAFMSLGMTIVTPSTAITALKDLGETAQKIQKLLNVLQKIIDLGKTIETSVKSIVAVTNALAQLKQAQLDMPTSLEWSEMSINFDASLAGVPSEVAGPKAKFSAAFKILVLRAQAMINAQSKIAQINAEIMLNKAQMKINEDQQKRLDKITQAIHFGNTSKAPNMSEVDLLSLTGHVQSQLNQVLGSLAQALAVQDSAVQYELLADPTPIRKFDLNSLQIVMVSQQANILSAKTNFNPPPFVVNDPIKYVIKGVPVSELINGNTYEFQIQPSATEFQPYNMVRIMQVLVDIPQITASKGGKYRIDLTCQGNPFVDRDQAGEQIVFNTIARNFGPYEYQAKDHKPIFGNQTGSIASDINRITPFSTWKVTLPKLDVNQGIEFGDNTTVDIALSFKIEALAQRAMYKYLDLKSLAAGKMKHAQLMNSMTEMIAQPAMKMKSAQTKKMLAADPATDESSLENMLNQMNKAQGVLKGWDCVLNMLEEPVNKFLAEQYKEKYPTAKPMTVEVGFCQSFNVGSNSLHAYTKFSVDLAQPLLEFQANNHNYVKVTQIIQKGSIQTGTAMVTGKGVSCPVPLNLKDPAIEWDDPKEIDTSKKPTVVGTVSLGMVQGIVTPELPDGSKGDKNDAHTVILDFTKGSFVANNLDIDTDLAQLNLQLQNWFVNNPIQYQINTVVFNTASTLVALQPTKFKLNVLTTNSKKNILQVFITTSGQEQTNLTINVNEPIPDGFQNSLMVNTKIMFQNIFVESFNKGSSNIQVESVNPENDYTAWKAKITSGKVTGSVDFGSHNTNSRQYRINSSGNSITWPLKGLTFSPTAMDGIALTYDQKQNVPFQSRGQSCSRYGCYWNSWKNYDVDVTVGLTGSYALEVANTGKDQQVQIASTTPKVELTPPDLKPTGPCECNDNDLKIMVGNVLQKQVPQSIENSMSGIQFEPVSLFALYNLLFPTLDFIAMQSAYVPGDLVVLGTFTKFVDDTK